MNLMEKLQTEYQIVITPDEGGVTLKTTLEGMAAPKESPLVEGFLRDLLPERERLVRKHLEAFDDARYQVLATMEGKASSDSSRTERAKGADRRGEDGEAEAIKRLCREMEKEKQAFNNMLDDLLVDHEGEFVSVFHGEVVASGSDPGLVHKEAHARVRERGYRPAHGIGPAVLTRRCVRRTQLEPVSAVESLPAVLRGTLR